MDGNVTSCNIRRRSGMTEARKSLCLLTVVSSFLLVILTYSPWKFPSMFHHLQVKSTNLGWINRHFVLHWPFRIFPRPLSTRCENWRSEPRRKLRQLPRHLTFVWSCNYRRKFRSQTSDNMDRWKAEKRREEKRKEEKRREEKKREEKRREERRRDETRR